MNKDKEWLIRELKKVSHEYQDGYLKVKAVDVLPLIDRLDEPEKLIIPQFVADWWECDGDSVKLYGGVRVDKKCKLYLISKFYDMGLGDYLSKVEEWIDENNSIFLDLVNGKPYEIEKEKYYHVINESNKVILRKHHGDIFPTIADYDKHVKCTTYGLFKLTEKEIKDYDERYWAFAEPVEEST